MSQTSPTPDADLPAFLWPKTTAEIEGLVAQVEAAFASVMDAVAA
eukprot:gene5525-5511_t